MTEMEQDWLYPRMQATGYAYDYRRPALTVDLVALFDSHILLVQRRYDPFAGCAALPGGYVEYGESAEQAAVREFREECGLTIPEHRIHPLPFRTNPGRDPRGWVISAPFRVNLTEQEFETATGGDDAEDELLRPNMLWDRNFPELAFDHQEILMAALSVRNVMFYG